MTLNIREARPEDLDRLMEIFDHARRFMQSVGNANQWINGYPGRELIASEIEKTHCYVGENATGSVVMTFCFISGPDPTYAEIIGGEWLDNKPYSVIHRLASDGSVPGVGKICLDWCASRDENLRVDTHEDNYIMQRLLESQGFVRCGTIYVSNGTPRIAYQRAVK